MKTTTRSIPATYWIALVSILFSRPFGRLWRRSAESCERARLTARIRKPTAMVLVDDGRLLLVANRQSGSISVIDPGTRLFLAEHDVGRGLADIVASPDDHRVLAVDQAAHEDLAAERTGRCDSGSRQASGQPRSGSHCSLARWFVVRGRFPLVTQADVR